MASSSGGCSDDDEMEIWTPVQNPRKRGGKEGNSMRTPASKRALTDDEERNEIRKKVMTEEFKVILKFKTDHEISTESPIALTNCLKKTLGDIDIAKVLRDGSLFVKCKTGGQRDKALKIQTICKKEVVERKVVGGGRGAKGKGTVALVMATRSSSSRVLCGL